MEIIMAVIVLIHTYSKTRSNTIHFPTRVFMNMQWVAISIYIDSNKTKNKENLYSGDH